MSNVNDLRILLGSDGIYRYKFSVELTNEYIILTYTIPKTNNQITESFPIFEQHSIIKKFNIKQCILNKALNKSKKLNRNIWLYSNDIKD